jgi:hypothetical protein
MKHSTNSRRNSRFALMNTLARTLLLVLFGLAARSLQAQFSDNTPSALSTASQSANIALERAEQRLNMQGPVFIENKGQWDRSVRFLLQGTRLDTWITDHGVVYDLYQLMPVKSSGKNSSQQLLSSDATVRHEPQAMARRGHVVAIEFLGTSFAPRARGVQRQPGVHNYFIGNDPGRWASNVALYAQAEMIGIYPGIDARYYLDDGLPRYDLVVSPGADPRQVRMNIKGATDIGVTLEGALSMVTSMGELEQRGLYAYQEIGGVRQQVKCGFVVDGSGDVRFDIGSYDQERPLVIDPITYSTYLGGSGDETGYAIAIDASGSAYVTGYTGSTTFPTTAGAYDATLGGNSDAFVTKLNSSGSALSYSTYLGGSSDDKGYAIAVDGNGVAYITGVTYSSSFPTTPSTYDAALGGATDAFVTKLSRGGNALGYSTYLGGSGGDEGYGIALGDNGTAYVTGYTSSTAFPTTAGAYDGTLGGSSDAFVKYLNGG